jgi:hypothetical protein
MACTVAEASFGPGRFDSNSGIAIRVTGKQAMIANAMMPNKIRIELVLSFILHLQVVLLMDGALNRNVPRFLACYKTVTTRWLCLFNSVQLSRAFGITL